MESAYRREPVPMGPAYEEDLADMERNTYINMRFFLQSMTNDNKVLYTFFGDVQKNQFFISENMRVRFGFPRNKVENLMEEWEKRIYGQDERAKYRADLRRLVEEKRTVHDLRYQVTDQAGRVLWVHCYANLEWNEDRTKPLFFAGRITQQDEDFLVDPISNLPGEIVMLRHLNEIQRSGKHCTVIGFCLNNIPQINIIQGRTYGNRLIREVSNQLVEGFRRKMYFYRLDGLRFMALLQPELEGDAETYVAELRKTIGDIYLNMGMPINHPSSFAVMEFPQDSLTSIDFYENLVSLIKFARDNQNQSYVEESEENIYEMQQLSNMELMLHRNVLNGMSDFRVVVQPVVSTEDGRTVGGETLLRWNCDCGDVSPGVFIPILERGDMIFTAGRWVFEQAVQVCSRMVQLRPDFYLTVNVSLRQLYDDGFLDFIPETLRKYGLEGRHLVVEMTESCMDKEPEKLYRLVSVCESLGIRIALDDFGSGYSSMRVLLKYPSGIIKLDRTLLLEMSESEEKLNFISSIVFACHKFGKTVCIEGVETEEQRKLAQEAGCDMIQGFYYYRPMEVEDLLRDAAHWN